MKGPSPALAAHMAGARVSAIMTGLFILAALVALFWKGPAYAAALALAAYLFHVTRPGPTAELDRETSPD